MSQTSNISCSFFILLFFFDFFRYDHFSFSFISFSILFKLIDYSLCFDFGGLILFNSIKWSINRQFYFVSFIKNKTAINQEVLKVQSDK